MKLLPLTLAGLLLLLGGKLVDLLFGEPLSATRTTIAPAHEAASAAAAAANSLTMTAARGAPAAARAAT
jgi:hypothetical protein